jgi:ankyrin repeat protein
MVAVSGPAANATVADLCDAAVHGDVQRIQKILNERPELVNVCLKENDERRALHFAVIHRHPDAVRVLMEAGADPRAGVYPHRDATSAAQVAEERGYNEIAQIIRGEEELRQRRACSNVVISPENEQLFNAIARDDFDLAVGLLDAHTELLDACQRNGGSVIYSAARFGRYQLVAELLRRGVDVAHLTPSGESPLDAAVLNARNDGRFSKNHLICAGMLLGAGQSLSLQSAVALGDGDVVREFVRRSPELFQSDPDASLKLLTIAVKHDQLEMVRTLLDAGLDPNETRRIKEYESEIFTQGEPLWIAAGESQYDIAELLLERGADPNADLYASGDPVSRAYNNCDERMKNLLFRYGGQLRPYVVASEGETAAAAALITQERRLATEMLNSAICGGNPDLVALCLRNLDKPPGAGTLWEAMCLWRLQPHRKHRDFDRTHYQTIFRMLLDAGVDPNERQRFGYRILHDVATAGVCWGQPIMTEPERCVFADILLECGAELNVIDDLLQSTPLGWAVRWGKQELATLLLDRGADPNLAGEAWAAPLAWAKKKGHDEIAALLRERGAC